MEIISVLLCTYNEPLKYLKLSIESILSQTYTNKYYWVADYKDKVGSDFMSWCVEFISSLMDERTKDVYSDGCA